MKKKIFLIIILVLLSFIACKVLLAGDVVTLQDVSPVGNLEGAKGIATIIGRLIKAVLGTIGAFALLMFVYGGYLMLMSGGKSEEINKGKNVLVWAVIGLAVTLGSYSLASFVITGITRGVPGTIGQFPGTTSTGPGGTNTNSSPGAITPGNICSTIPGGGYECQNADWMQAFKYDSDCKTSAQYQCPIPGDYCCKRKNLQYATRCTILPAANDDRGGLGACYDSKYFEASCIEQLSTTSPITGTISGSAYSICPTGWDTKNYINEDDCPSKICCCLLASTITTYRCKKNDMCYDTICKSMGRNDIDSCKEIFSDQSKVYTPKSINVSDIYSGEECQKVCSTIGNQRMFQGSAP